MKHTRDKERIANIKSKYFFWCALRESHAIDMLINDSQFCTL